MVEDTDFGCKRQKQLVHTVISLFLASVAGIPIVLVGIGGLIPLVYLLTKAFSAEATALVEIVFRWRNARLFLNTLLLTAGVLALDLLIATPAAWLTTRVNLKGKRLFTVLCVLPLAIPGYVMAYALLALGGNTGIAAQLFGTSIPRLKWLLGRAPRAQCLHKPLISF